MREAKLFCLPFIWGEIVLKFYDVDNNYVKYLQSHDKQIPNILYSSNNKFVCGIVLTVNDCDYYAPISSSTQLYRTSYPIKDSNGIIIATIRFCFMFPVPLDLLTEKDFSLIRQYDSAYADLLLKEWSDCKSNEAAILTKAQSVYKIGCNKSHKFNYTCCDFSFLELKMKEYIVQNQEKNMVEDDNEEQATAVS